MQRRGDTTAVPSNALCDPHISMKWNLGYGTRLLWNSLTSTLRATSNPGEEVNDDKSYTSV
jgi:hypothetical protein